MERHWNKNVVKPARGQLSLAYCTRVKTDMPEENEKQLESVWWVKR